MSRSRRLLTTALTATAVLVIPLSLLVPAGTATAATAATAATPDSFSIGAGAGVLPGGTGAVIPITYRCTSSLPYVVVVATQAATHGRVAQAGGSFAPTCDGAKHALDVVAGVQNATPMHPGPAAIQVQSPMPGGLQKVVTLGTATFTTPGVVASARRYGGGAVITVTVPDAACPAGGTATGLASLTQRVGQQIQTGQSANYPREGPPSVPCEQAQPNLPLAVIAPVHPWSLLPALVTVQLEVCSTTTCTGWTQSTVVQVTATQPGSQP